jgi:hypothetical protein
MTASPDTTARESGFLAGTWLVLAPTLLAVTSVLVGQHVGRR